MPPDASIPRVAATISALVADASDRERVTPGRRQEWLDV